MRDGFVVDADGKRADLHPAAVDFTPIAAGGPLGIGGDDAIAEIIGVGLGLKTNDVIGAEAAKNPLVLVGGQGACHFRPRPRDMQKTDIKEMRATLAAKGNWFRSIAGADHRRLEWRPILDFPTDALAREARSADLIVIGHTMGAGDAYRSLDPGGLPLKIGRPTLVVPERVSSLRAERVVIGWKDTREARRAVQDALPFLHKAASVTVVEICGLGEEGAAQEHVGDVVRYLTRHRINGGTRVIPNQQGSGAAQLIKLAQDEGADWLVTGAYGHSRLGEWIFGGMTRDLLATTSICCLMSH